MEGHRLPDDLAKVETGQPAGHDHIGEQQVDLVIVGQHRDRFVAIFRRHDIVAQAFELIARMVADKLMVLDDQDGADARVDDARGSGPGLSSASLRRRRGKVEAERRALARFGFHVDMAARIA